MDERQVSAWVSDDRFASFLAVADGDFARALSTYRWHVDLCMAVFGLVHEFEVLIRNAIDRELGDGQPQSPIGMTWLMDFETLHPWAVKQVAAAVERLPRDVPLTRGRVVAGLSFGFWASLFGRRYEQLWRTRLHHAFPHASEGRDGVGRRMRALQAVRNRVAHHDSLLEVDVTAAARMMSTLAGWIDPAAAVWLRRVARVEELVARRP
ncbi:hypothetical protein [Conexibacter arvalis]|uniref:Abi-like protein n=1 Tax=Conexibacter arvalis TaxID=912552 RepID=A0A840I930_9ACTN|nr:hypothetical protein [Conexibacter arvalis]MBB4660825.1 hypothetical protein [Conexibacter arvalis]